jgi:hypothetical protein
MKKYFFKVLKKNWPLYSILILIILSLAINLYLYKKNTKKLNTDIIKENQKRIFDNFVTITKFRVSQVFSLYYHKNFIYASSTFHNRVVKLDMNLNNIGIMNENGIFEKIVNDDGLFFEKNNEVVGGIINVHSFAFDKMDNMYISRYLPEDTNNNKAPGITVVPSGACLEKCKIDDFLYFDDWNGISHITIGADEEKLLVADYGNGDFQEGDIYILDLKNLKVRTKLSKLSGYKFKKPHMIRFNDNNKFYYALDVRNKEIIIFDKNFNLVKVISNNLLKQINKNIKRELFKTITAITFSENYIFVSDVGNHAIYIFDYSWNLKFKIEKNQFFSYENQDALLLKLFDVNEFILNSPYDILFKDDKLYIANTHNDEIVILQINELYNF